MLPCQELPPRSTRVPQVSCRATDTQGHHCCRTEHSTITPAGGTGKQVAASSSSRGTAGDCAQPCSTLTTQYEYAVSGACIANLTKGRTLGRKGSLRGGALFGNVGIAITRAGSVPGVCTRACQPVGVVPSRASAGLAPWTASAADCCSQWHAGRGTASPHQ